MAVNLSWRARNNYRHFKAVHLDKPEMEISRLPFPLFSNKNWKKSVVNNVVFPTVTLFENDLYAYYGAADKHTVAK
jgi:predicted GH43/DUF377 family glycosyl hydrolase